MVNDLVLVYSNCNFKIFPTATTCKLYMYWGSFVSYLIMLGNFCLIEGLLVKISTNGQFSNVKFICDMISTCTFSYKASISHIVLLLHV